MYSKTSKWISVLSILLALLSMGELIFTGTALYLVSIILAKTGGYVTSICGLIASLVSMPIAFKVRSFYSSMEIRVHHYDMQTYHRFMLYISLAVQTFCIIICCVSLGQIQDVEVALTSAITRYQLRYSDKKFVDIIQVLFQCCGIFSYQDWAQDSWTSTLTQEIRCRKSVYEAIESNNQTLKDVNSLYSVPFSCCKIENHKPCRNFDLKCSGVESINTNGCLEDLSGFVISILVSELAIFLFIVVVIGALLKLFSIEECELCRDEFEDFDDLEDLMNCEDNQDDRWQKFINCPENCSDIQRMDESCSAELIPSSQEQLVLTCNKKAKLFPTSSEFELLPEESTSTSSSDDECCCKRSSYDDKDLEEVCYSLGFEKKVRFQ